MRFFIAKSNNLASFSMFFFCCFNVFMLCWYFYHPPQFIFIYPLLFSFLSLLIFSSHLTGNFIRESQHLIHLHRLCWLGFPSGVPSDTPSWFLSLQPSDFVFKCVPEIVLLPLLPSVHPLPQSSAQIFVRPHSVHISMGTHTSFCFRCLNPYPKIGLSPIFSSAHRLPQSCAQI